MSYTVTFYVIFCTFKNALSLKQSLFQPVRVVIFDMDGLLLGKCHCFNTESIYFGVHSVIFARFNKTYTKNMEWQFTGTNFSTEFLVDSFGLKITPEEYLEEFEKLCVEKLTTMKFMPGAEKLVNHLHLHKLPMAIATNNIEQFFDVIPAYYKNFFKLFHHIVTLSDPAVKNGKPDPEIFSICMQRFQMSLEPEQVLVMEDSPRGVLGARRAGMQVVMVPDPELPEYLRINATKVLSSLEHFQPSEFGLPSYKN